MLDRSRTTIRALAIALAALALVGPFAGFAHLVAVDHVACEHGELIEVGRRQTVAISAARRTAVGEVRAASVADSHGHEHCLLASMRRERLGLRVQRPSSVTVQVAQRLATAADEVTVPAPIAVLDLAPKNSPPLV